MKDWVYFISVFYKGLPGGLAGVLLFVLAGRLCFEAFQSVKCAISMEG